MTCSRGFFFKVSIRLFLKNKEVKTDFFNASAKVVSMSNKKCETLQLE